MEMIFVQYVFLCTVLFFYNVPVCGRGVGIGLQLWNQQISLFSNFLFSYELIPKNGEAYFVKYSDLCFSFVANLLETVRSSKIDCHYSTIF
jgi:hypothetical protein